MMHARRVAIRWLAFGAMLLLLAACGMGVTPTELSETTPDQPFLSVLSVGGTVTGDKTVAPDDLLCGASATVTLSLAGQVSIAENPVDIMLVLDRSGSMSGTPLTNLKAAANKLVDLIEDTNASLPPSVTVFSRVGVVSFETNATLNQALTSDLDDVRGAINGLVTGNLTAIGDGINLAQAQLAGSEPARPKVMVVVTDGQNNAGANPVTAATNAKGAGTEIFVIGFGNVNAGQLAAIASDPDSDYLFISPDVDGGDLDAAFEALGEALIQPAGTGITVVDTVNPNFAVSNAVASKGNVAVAGNVLTWTIDELGTENATLTYDVTHDDTKPGGNQAVNTSVVYTDDQGKSVTFPDPTVDVRGCAANLTLAPKTDDNIVGDDHTVTATVTDDYGDPVAGITVEFSVVGGPSIVDGDPSNPMPDNGSDTTDAAGEASFTYTNSEASPDTITATAPFGQANVSVALVDTAEKTWLPVEVPIDVHPRSCPNPFNVTRRGVLPVAIVGTADFDVTTVDLPTLRLEGVEPLRSSFEDVVAPYEPYTGKTDELDCTTAGPDGYLDLVLHFDAQAVAAAIAPVSNGEVRTLVLTGEFLVGGIGFDFVGEDVVRIIAR
jgi:uncharacterized protein YegL